MEFQHGASVLAEWLDNDEDGCVDTPEVLLAAILIFIRSSQIIIFQVLEEFLSPRDVGYGHGLVQASIVFPGTRADVDKDVIIEAMGAEGYFFATMVYLVDDPNHNFGLLPECSGTCC